MSVNCVSGEVLIFLQAHAHEGAGAPFVLVDDHVLVVEERVVHHQGGSGKIAGREIVHDGGPLVENHVQAHGLRLLALATHGEVVAVVDDEGGQHGEVEQPLAAEHPVVAIAAADAEVAHVEAHAGSLRTPADEVVGGLDASCLVADAGEPRPRRAALDVALSEGCWEREAAVVEGVEGGQVEHLHLHVVALQPMRPTVAVDVTGERLRPLVAGIEAQTAAVEVQVELVVLVHPTPLRRIDGQAHADAPVDSGQREGGLVAGAEVGLGIDVVDGSLGVEGVARLVQAGLEGEPAGGAHHVVGVVGGAIVAFGQHAVHPRPPLLGGALLCHGCNSNQQQHDDGQKSLIHTHVGLANQ